MLELLSQLIVLEPFFAPALYGGLSFVLLVGVVAILWLNEGAFGVSDSETTYTVVVVSIAIRYIVFVSLLSAMLPTMPLMVGVLTVVAFCLEELIPQSPNYLSVEMVTIVTHTLIVFIVSMVFV